MALLSIEFYEDGDMRTETSESIYGRLISSHEDTSLSTSVEHATVPGNCAYVAVYSDTACYVEIGSGNQDVASGRRMVIPAGFIRDFDVRPGETVSYRSIA